MNTNTRYYCHYCNTEIFNPHIDELGFIKCTGCNNEHVEIIDNNNIDNNIPPPTHSNNTFTPPNISNSMPHHYVTNINGTNVHFHYYTYSNNNNMFPPRVLFPPQFNNAGDYYFGDMNSLANAIFNSYNSPNTPTAQIIIETLPELTFKEFQEENKTNPKSNPTCSVCLENYKNSDYISELPCKHIFHKNCIFPWLKSHNICPMCRYKLATEEEVS